MTTYGQFCAVARALELLGERWTLLVARELLMGARGFNEIQRGLRRIPRATLADRLRSLQRHGVVERDGDQYALTDAGRALLPVVAELARWAMTWDRRELTAEHLDTETLVWDIRRRVDRSRLPEREVVVALEFTDRSPGDRHFWLHLSREQVELCRTDTGDPVHVWLTATTEPVVRWWLGELPWGALLRHDGVALRGDTAVRRAMGEWFQRYAFADFATVRRPAVSRGR